MILSKHNWLGAALLISLSTGCALPQFARQSEGEVQSENLEAQLSLARLSERNGKLDFAKQIYETVLRSNPQHKLAHHRLGIIAARRSRPHDAQQHFESAIQAGNPSVALLNDYGYCLYLRNDLVKAEQTFREALQRDPDFAAAGNNLALVLGDQGRLEECLQQFRQHGTESDALANFAYVKSQRGEIDQAEQLYHQALAMDDKMKPAAEALLQLASVTGKIPNTPAPILPADTAVAAAEPAASPTGSSFSQSLAQSQPQPLPPAATIAQVGAETPAALSQSLPTTPIVTQSLASTPVTSAPIKQAAPASHIMTADHAISKLTETDHPVVATPLNVARAEQQRSSDAPRSAVDMRPGTLEQRVARALARSDAQQRLQPAGFEDTGSQHAEAKTAEYMNWGELFSTQQESMSADPNAFRGWGSVFEKQRTNLPAAGLQQQQK